LGIIKAIAQLKHRDTLQKCGCKRLIAGGELRDTLTQCNLLIGR
jgi:hypothetical protein